MKTKHGQDLPLWVYVLMFSTQLLLCLACIAVVETLLTRLWEERSIVDILFYTVQTILVGIFAGSLLLWKSKGRAK